MDKLDIVKKKRNKKIAFSGCGKSLWSEFEQINPLVTLTCSYPSSTHWLVELIRNVIEQDKQNTYESSDVA